MAGSTKLMRVAVASLAWLCLLSVPVCVWGQQNDSGSQPSSPAPAANSASQPAPPSTPKKKKPEEDNPFPMEQSQAAAKPNSQPDQPQPASASAGKGTAANGAGPSSADAKKNKQSPAKDNPFPEDQSKAAAKPDHGANDANSAGGSRGAQSSSDQGYSSSDEHLPPPDLGQGTLSSHRKPDSFTRDQTLNGRIQDDINVADFYMKNGNYRGAFLRYDDALQADPNNDAALYGKADAMCKQNLTGKAMAQFKSYVKNNPQGKYALKAEKMLSHPNKCMHNF
ncbi:MAG: tetratricopeptide repeat protein [Acidobacteriaceae bacterium]